jgi:SAM-dependent methyltransferase
MDPVKRHYEAYPYPERNPADEARRLIVGSPSHPLEIDHFLFRGQRDWSAPFRALVAGGGTGDALIMLAQVLRDAGCPADITYLDTSAASRAIAEARAQARGLTGIRFRTGDLLTAPELGPFDYIDCCGVLHHLPEPQAGFDALSAALDPAGGMGLMVYAPYGRTGVYPLQQALRALLADDDPDQQLKLAKKIVGQLPATNWFTRNTFVGDHTASDAGFYDLLLHSQDRPFDVTALDGALAAAGLARVSFLQAERYNPVRYLPKSADIDARLACLDATGRAALAERLAGDMKAHVVYAAKADRAAQAMAQPTAAAVPHLAAVAPGPLAQQIAQQGGFNCDTGGVSYRVEIPKSAAPIIAHLDGHKPLAAIAEAVRLDWLAFSTLFAPVHTHLTGFNLLRYSKSLR